MYMYYVWRKWHEQNLRSWGELIFFRDILEAFARRRLRNTRFATLEESHRRSLFHRSAQVKIKKLRPPSPFWDLCAYFPNQLYAILTWTAVGMMFFISTRPKTEEELAMKVMWGLYKNLKAKKNRLLNQKRPTTAWWKRVEPCGGLRLLKAPKKCRTPSPWRSHYHT